MSLLHLPLYTFNFYSYKIKINIRVKSFIYDIKW